MKTRAKAAGMVGGIEQTRGGVRIVPGRCGFVGCLGLVVGGAGKRARRRSWRPNRTGSCRGCTEAEAAGLASLAGGCLQMCDGAGGRETACSTAGVAVGVAWVAREVGEVEGSWAGKLTMASRPGPSCQSTRTDVEILGGALGLRCGKSLAVLPLAVKVVWTRRMVFGLATWEHGAPWVLRCW